MKQILFRIATAMFLLLWLSLNACNTDSSADGNTDTENATKSEIAQSGNSGAPYDFANPEKKFLLPDKLKEISGIAAISENKLACVQDELGKIFFFNLTTGEVEKAIDFAGKGDYEGIAIKNDDAYILRSDGVIFFVKNFQSESPQVKEFKTFLSEKNDTEGLCYDIENNRLLIACKGKGGEGDQFKGKKAVYEFDLSKEELKEKPVFLINAKEVKESLKATTGEQIAEFMSEDDGSGFQPSEIALHPITGELYITSASGKAVVRLNKKGEILKIHKLDASTFKQPEGIAFLPNGDILISNEGQDGSANILWFKYRKK